MERQRHNYHIERHRDITTTTWRDRDITTTLRDTET